MRVRPTTAAAVCVICWATTSAAGPPRRSGPTLPREDRRVEVQVDVGGGVIPGTGARAGRGFVDGHLLWNLGITRWLGLFGEHAVGVYVDGGSGSGSDSYYMLAFGHEVGGRLKPWPFLAVEAAYLGHRVEREWIDGTPVAAGGVFDHGGELGVWGQLKPLEALTVEGHLLGRYFGEPDPDLTNPNALNHYADEQWIGGAGLRVAMRPARRHEIDIELTGLIVHRAGRLRENVDETDWNAIGVVGWSASLTEHLGLRLEVELSANLAMGERPMLELRRSQHGQPLGRLCLGLFFAI